ncbi:MAG: hypothetical protein AAGF20_08310 [Pseudomonadota bacterium]
MSVVKSGLVAVIAAVGLCAYADVSKADVWIGFDDNLNGFLLNQETGAVWMTGPCLKPLEKAVKDGPVWRSRTVEMVSVGRSFGVLDQTFELDLSSPSVTVTSAGRGGPQRFVAEIDTTCVPGGPCAELKRTQTLCQDN